MQLPLEDELEELGELEELELLDELGPLDELEEPEDELLMVLPQGCENIEGDLVNRLPVGEMVSPESSGCNFRSRSL